MKRSLPAVSWLLLSSAACSILVDVDGLATGSTPRSDAGLPLDSVDVDLDSGTSDTAAPCSSGECVHCSAGDKDCLGDVPRTCSDAGTWVNAPACTGATPLCRQGACVASSCDGLASICGPARNESCCAQSAVPGGVFDRGNDATYPATVSAFSLDRFEVTVGRFRRFVEAYPANKPASGAGAHPNIFGSGWSFGWSANLPADRAALVSSLKCYPPAQTWTDDAGPNEQLPINCVSWYVAFAFCAWDGGRLPTEAEWNFAAAGGSEQRLYAWGSDLDSYHAVYNGDPIARAGSRSSQGDGRYGHADLTGNVWEWTLDFKGSYPNPCIDCANLTASGERVFRGGGWYNTAAWQPTSFRYSYPPTYARAEIGVRCVRP